MRRSVLLPLALALLLAVAGVRADAQQQVRGVRPRDVERYRATVFQCLNGVGSVAASQINDEYCDCADGSDEPGTSACANSQFFCRNSGAKSLVLPSSRVDDGICDCCDGSDEHAAYSQVHCPNTCEEAGRAAREALARDLAAAQAGLAARAALVAKATATLAEKKAKMAHYEKIMAERTVALEQAKAAKDEQEAVEQTERERRAAEKAAAEAAAAPATPAATTEGAVPDDAATATAPSEVPVETPVATPDAAAAAPAEPAANFPYPAEYAYKPSEDAAAAAPAVAEEPAAVNFPYPAEYAYNPDAAAAATATAPAAAQVEELVSEDAEDDDEEASTTAAAAATDVPATAFAAEQEEEKEYVHAAAEAARAAFTALEDKMSKLRAKMTKLQQTLDASYGPEGEFLHMDGTCFPLAIKQYTYEMCPYSKAAQKEGGSSTSLGNWEGLEQRPDGQWAMKFAHGQSCWQGPQRSLTVLLQCGETDAPLSVDEPSKCVYEMRFQTPAVCDEAHKTALQQRASNGSDEAENAHARDEL